MQRLLYSSLFRIDDIHYALITTTRPVKSSMWNVPLQKHLFQNKPYPEFARQIIREVFVPYWYLFLLLHPRRAVYEPALFENAIWFNPDGNYGFRRPRSPLRKRADWVFYVIGFPFRMFVAIIRLVIRPLMYPAVFLLGREFLYLPQKRLILQDAKADGVRVTGTIHCTNIRGRPLLRFMLPTSESQLTCHHIAYQFSEDEVAIIQEAFGKDSGSLLDGDMYDLIIHPYYPKGAGYYLHLLYSKCNRNTAAPKEYYQIWTESLLTSKTLEPGIKCSWYDTTRNISVGVLHGGLFVLLAGIVACSIHLLITFGLWRLVTGRVSMTFASGTFWRITIICNDPSDERLGILLDILQVLKGCSLMTIGFSTVCDFPSPYFWDSGTIVVQTDCSHDSRPNQ